MARRFSVQAALPPTEALFAWADLDRVTEWMDGVTRVSDVSGRPDNPAFTLPGATLPLAISPGSRYTLWYGRRPVRVEVLRDERGPSVTTYRLRLDGTARRGEMLLTFEPDGSASRVTLEVRPSGRWAGLASRLLGVGSYRGSYRGTLRSFARFAERERWRRQVL